MSPVLFYTAGESPSLSAAIRILERKHFPVFTHPSPEVTHVLLPTPALSAPDTVTGGGSLQRCLSMLPENVTIIGGKLPEEELSEYRRFDLLEDPFFVTENAEITAHCALQIAMNCMTITFRNCPVLILGYGRIGKSLCRLLGGLGATVYVAARKETDRALGCVFGFSGISFPEAYATLPRYKVIFNTVPAPVLTQTQCSRCDPSCLKIDLASAPGILTQDVHIARGLPGKYAPESTGALIADTVLRIMKKE